MSNTRRVNVEERLVNSMYSLEYMSLRQVTDAANIDEGSFILGMGAVQACLDRMIAKGSVMILRGDPVAKIATLYQFTCHPDCVERATCELAGKPGHGGCGTCKTHNRPLHHCAHSECHNV